MALRSQGFKKTLVVLLGGHLDKVEMREWVSALEGMIDNKLQKWKKFNSVEDDESVALQWQFEQTFMILNIHWKEDKEGVHLRCLGSSVCHGYFFHGLNDKTFNKICDRVGNLAQVIMHPPIDPMD